MLKRVSLYVAALFSVALLMTAGCATQDVVKKGRGNRTSTGCKTG